MVWDWIGVKGIRSSRAKNNFIFSALGFKRQSQNIFEVTQLVYDPYAVALNYFQ